MSPFAAVSADKLAPCQPSNCFACPAVLGVSGVLESHSLYVAVNTLRRRAAQQGMGLLAYIRTGADPAAVAVMMEDSAAVAGLVVAAGCLGLCQVRPELGAVQGPAVHHYACRET